MGKTLDNVIFFIFFEKATYFCPKIKTMELSKPDKKIARILIDKGIEREFAKHLLKSKQILEAWNPEMEDHKPSYYALYKQVEDFDKHIGRRYDNLRGGDYFYKVVELLRDDVITLKEVNGFSEDVRTRLHFLMTL
jgi:predicted transcriptional regulator